MRSSGMDGGEEGVKEWVEEVSTGSDADQQRVRRAAAEGFIQIHIVSSVCPASVGLSWFQIIHFLHFLFNQ